jgi:hypothetical protein
VRLFDEDLEERVAVALVFDRDMREIAQDLDGGDFTQILAGYLFGCFRNVEATCTERMKAWSSSWLDLVVARVQLDDWHAQRDEWLTRGDIADLLVKHGSFDSTLDMARAVIDLRKLRVRRERVCALADQAQTRRVA